MTAARGKNPPKRASREGEPSAAKSGDTLKLSDDSIVQASVATRAVWLTDDAVVLDVLTDRVFRLNSTAGYIWSLLQLPRRVDELKDMVRAAYGIDRTETHEAIDDLLEGFLGVGLIGTTEHDDETTESIVKQP